MLRRMTRHAPAIALAAALALGACKRSQQEASTPAPASTITASAAALPSPAPGEDRAFAIPTKDLPSFVEASLGLSRSAANGAELLPKDPETLVRDAFECQLLRKPDEESVWLEAQPDMVALYYANIGLCWADDLPSIERVEGYHERSCAPKAAARAALARAVDRRPEALRALFDRYKPLLFRAVPAERYRRTKMPALLDALLEAHERMKEDPETPKKLADAYAATVAAHAESQDDPYGDDWCAALGDVDPDAPYDHRSCWVKSFWVRREKEGNRAVVAAILEEVRTHYAALSHVGLNTKPSKAPGCTEVLDEPRSEDEPEGD